MRESLMTDRWVTSPRSSYQVRPRSNREVYRPAVQDLSQQAARNGQSYQQDEPILSVINSYTPRSSRPGTETSSERPRPPSPLSVHDDAIKPSTNQTLCFNQHNQDYHEDLHRQRVLVSAHHRRKLHSIRRAKSTPAPHSRDGSVSDSNTAAGQHRSSWQSPEEERNKVELVITNSMKADDYEFKERINYRLTSRTKPKSSKAATLQPAGAPLPLLNGYSQTLIQNYPMYSQQYCRWLTHGLKVQSFRGHPASTPYTQYTQSRPAPTLVQYLNRPKTYHGKRPTNRGTQSVDFNIVGVQKGMKQSDNSAQQLAKHGERNAENE